MVFKLLAKRPALAKADGCIWRLRPKRVTDIILLFVSLFLWCLQPGVFRYWGILLCRQARTFLLHEILIGSCHRTSAEVKAGEIQIIPNTFGIHFLFLKGSDKFHGFFLCFLNRFEVDFLCSLWSQIYQVLQMPICTH